MKSKENDKPSVVKEILRLKKLPQSARVILKIKKLQQLL
tara:strand:+ start:1577 stop:1693 length:117 start_codon:yes stop_codon:yes gene_type:complete